MWFRWKTVFLRDRREFASVVGILPALLHEAGQGPSSFLSVLKGTEISNHRTQPKGLTEFKIFLSKISRGLSKMLTLKKQPVRLFLFRSEKTNYALPSTWSSESSDSSSTGDRRFVKSSLACFLVFSLSCTYSCPALLAIICTKRKQQEFSRFCCHLWHSPPSNLCGEQMTLRFLGFICTPPNFMVCWGPCKPGNVQIHTILRSILQGCNQFRVSNPMTTRDTYFEYLTVLFCQFILQLHNEWFAGTCN